MYMKFGSFLGFCILIYVAIFLFKKEIKNRGFDEM